AERGAPDREAGALAYARGTLTAERLRAAASDPCLAHQRGCPPEEHGGREIAALDAADLRVPEIERDQIGRRARNDPGRSETEAACTVARETTPERRRRSAVPVGDEDVAPAAQPARAPLRLARLLEGIQAYIRVGAARDRHVALPELGRRQEAVTEIGLGRRTRTDRGARPGQ